MGACFVVVSIVKEQTEHRAGVEPTSPHYGCGVLAARRPVRVVSGTRGSRTLTRPVKSRGCCLNTSVPGCHFRFLLIQLARRELNPRPASYKDAALTAELRASSWAGGIRTHTRLIKSQGCSLYTTTQDWLGRIRLLRIDVDITLLLVVRSDF
jgi:hypothetical protein